MSGQASHARGLANYHVRQLVLLTSGFLSDRDFTVGGLSLLSDFVLLGVFSTGWDFVVVRCLDDLICCT